MCVYNGVNVGSFLVNSHVHFDFGGRLEALVRLNYFTVSVNLADEFRSHEALGYTGRSAKEFVFADLYGDVTVVSSNHALVVDSLTDFANLFFDFVFAYHHDSSLL